MRRSDINIAPCGRPQNRGMDLQHLKVVLLEIVFLKNIKISQLNGKMDGIMRRILKITM